MKLEFYLWFSALIFIVALVYAMLILKPLINDNKAMRTRVAEIETVSSKMASLEKSLALLQNEFNGESSSYRRMLLDLRSWHGEAHTHISRIAADADLEMTLIKWSDTESVIPAFKKDKHWLRTGVFVKLVGTWWAHRKFTQKLSDCECLVQIIEEKVTVSEHPELVEVLMSFFIYYLDEGVNV